MDSALTSKGQATIPKPVREYLHLSPGDRVKFFMHPDGHVAMLPKLPIIALKGILPRHSENTFSVEQMDQGIVESVSDRDRRSQER